jgi:hypothetical protein
MDNGSATTKSMRHYSFTRKLYMKKSRYFEYCFAYARKLQRTMYEKYHIKTSIFSNLLYTSREDFLIPFSMPAHKITVELLQDIAHVGRK